jgi:hypothetical protein
MRVDELRGRLLLLVGDLVAGVQPEVRQVDGGDPQYDSPHFLGALHIEKQTEGTQR